MAKFHVNPTTGEPGKCTAQKNCPFGGPEVHYTSMEAARASYEASQEANTFTMPLKAMNAAAKSTDDPELLEKLIESGSDRTLGNLAKNPNLTTQQAEKILKKTKSPAIRAALYMNKRLVLKFDEITPDDLEEIAAKQNPRDTDPLYYPTDNPLARMAKDPFITEAHFNRLYYSDRVPANVKKGLPTLLAENNKIPPVRTRHWLEENDWPRWPLSPDKALRSGKLSEETLAAAPNSYIQSFSAVGPSPNLTTREVDMLARVAVARRDERLAMMTAKDHRISSSELDRIVRAGYGHEEVFGNPKASKETKAWLASLHPDEPYVRVNQLKERIGEQEFEKLKSNAGESQLGRAYHESRLAFDTAKVKEYGLTREDIFYIAGSRRFNAGTSYDEATGIFSGRVDSSD